MCVAQRMNALMILLVIGLLSLTGLASTVKQNTESAKQASQLAIAASVSKATEGTAQLENAGKTMEEIVSSVKGVRDMIAEISAASHEQSANLNQVNHAVTSMNEVTQSNADLVEQVAATAESHSQQVNQLNDTPSVFK